MDESNERKRLRQQRLSRRAVLGATALGAGALGLAVPGISSILAARETTPTGETAYHSRSATLVVAASNASPQSKLGSDFVCDGTADEVEINAAIAALPVGGGKVVLTEGTFTISASILMPTSDFFWLEGSGQKGTQIILASRVNDYAIKKAPGAATYQQKISNLYIDANVTNNPTGGGINLTGLPCCHLEDVYIRYPGTKYGIYADGDTLTSDCIKLRDVGVGEGSSHGFYLKTIYALQAHGCYSTGNAGDGWLFEGGGEHLVIGALADENECHGFNLYGVNRSYFNVMATQNVKAGVNVESVSTRLVVDAIIFRCPSADPSSNYGLRVMGVGAGAGPHDNYFRVYIGEHIGAAQSIKIEGVGSSGTNNYITGRVEGAVSDTAGGNVYRDLQGYHAPGETGVLEGWVLDDAQNPTLGTLPANAVVTAVDVWVEEAFDAGGADDSLTVGYDGDTDAYIATGLNMTTLGLREHITEGHGNASTTLGKIDATSRSVEAYLTHTGNEPTTGKAHIIVHYMVATAEPA